MKIRGTGDRILEYYLRKPKKKIEVRLQFKGNLLKGVKVKEIRRDVRKNTNEGGGATGRRFDFLA